MVFKVQSLDRHWQVIHPTLPEPVHFRDGAVAFDFADRLARAQHGRTGSCCTVRVEVMDAQVDAVRYG
ncbi:MAG TPA: hypothetical protein DCM50_02100 [Stenotrophomonas sp.]|nr:hypothetical protein [Stenotrophomonas sp.]